jgi:hypothetical protein
MRREFFAISSIAIAGVLLVSSIALAQDAISISPDTAIVLGVTNQTTADHDVAVDNLVGMAMLTNLGALPPNCDVTAYAVLSIGDRLFACDVSVELPGPVVARRGDVIRFNRTTYTIELDSRAAGGPSGAVADAVAGGSSLLLSFDTTVDLGGVIAEDEDLVRWDGMSWSLAFDASAAGIDPPLDLDAASYLGGSTYAASFDGSGSVGGVSFDDEDVLQYDGQTWTLVFDGSAQDADWAGADLDAVALPEPSEALLLLAGCGLLAALRGRRVLPPRDGH